MEQITSRTNPLITRFRKLASDRKLRRKEGLMVCEGPKLLSEALSWGFVPETALVTEDFSGTLPEKSRTVQVPADLLKSVAPTQTPQKVLFLAPLPSIPLPEALPGNLYLVLDGLQDPGNVGTLWRTADAFRADGLILLPGCADPWSPKTVRATMGACFRLPVWEATLEEALSLFARSGLPLYATALRDDTLDLRELSPDKAAIAIGSEGHGVSQALLDACSATVKIPMSDRCESLNAAVAGAVVLWEFARKDL